MKKYKVGLLIGRFQPFHKGHLFLIKKAFEYVEKLIIGIGTANRVDQENPWTIEARRKMLEKVLDSESHFAPNTRGYVRDKTLKERVLKIVPIDDYLEDDNLWLKKALERIGKFDVLIGNDEWTDGIFEKAGYTVLRLGFYKRYLYEGEKIRKLMMKGGKWQERIPEYLISNFKL